MKNHILRISLITLFACTIIAHGQGLAAPAPPQGAPAAAKTFQLDSKLMARQMPYSVVLPPNYETDKQARFPVIYLLHGFGGSYKVYFSIPKVLEYISQGHFIFVSVEGGTGFYTDSATKPNDKYESYVVRELIPEVDKNFRTDATRNGRAIAGISMGGYGALKFAVKYPQMFALAVSWSGGVTAAAWRKPSDLLIPRFVPALTATFGDGTDPSTLIANDLFKLLTDLPADKVPGLPFLYLDCGTDDELQLTKPNLELARIMLDRKIRHEYREFPGGHATWQDFRLPYLLELSGRMLTQRKAALGGK